jgi:hypothetical protein
MIEKPLTIAEGEELQAIREVVLNGSFSLDEYARYCELTNRCLLYGSEGVDPKPFEGLEPRYAVSNLEAFKDQYLTEWEK